ncbi:hypothetical protein [Heliorestis convoluta]|uniref:S-layer domain-containing protein n=1 Tax=Heliorestis convoluta TaxID=356322 RepID=A0A5Q2N0B3_9FIRM|nr:hypothetical protein [Heliorestis convoluta]QGG47219.1 Putative S-layer domain-containing protein [Heliorestis convoluta]
MTRKRTSKILPILLVLTMLFTLIAPAGMAFATTPKLEVIGSVDLDFGQLPKGYKSIPEKTVTVTAREADFLHLTPDLKVFEVKPVAGLNRLLENERVTFTISPTPEMLQSPGEYKETLEIYGVADVSGRPTSILEYPVNLIIADLTHNIEGNNKVFASVTEGYAENEMEEALTVTITAIGEHNDVTVMLSGEDSNSFVLDNAPNKKKIEFDNVKDETVTFTVRPQHGLTSQTHTEKTHTAEITITSDMFPEGISFTLTQVVKPIPEIKLHGISTKIEFEDVTEGYQEVQGIEVAFTTVGDHANVKASIDDNGAKNFKLIKNGSSKTNFDFGDLQHNREIKFIVKPELGLEAKKLATEEREPEEYTATITITSDKDEVSFIVKQVVNPKGTYSINIDPVIDGTAQVITNPSKRAAKGDIVTIYISDIEVGKRPRIVTVNGGQVSVTPVEGKVGEYTFVMPEELAAVEVSLGNIRGHIVHLKDKNNILLVGEHAFELGNEQYNLNNFLKASDNYLDMTQDGKYAIYYKAGGKWYNLVKAEGIGLVEAAEVKDLNQINSRINKKGIYTYMNMGEPDNL